MKRTLLLLAITLTSFLFLISPALPAAKQKEKCANLIQISNRLSFPLNCDSWDFLAATANLSDLIYKNTPYQSRPLYILLGKTFSYPFVILRETSITNSFPYFSGLLTGNRLEKFSGADKNYDAYHSGYLILNLIILFLALQLFINYLGPKLTIYSIAAACLLIMNDVVKVFVFTPHTQMLNILTPIFFTWISYLILNKNKLLTNHPYYFSLISGVLFLVYGNFAILIPLYFVSLYLARERQSISVWFKNIFSSLILFFLPLFVWTNTIKLAGGKYYNQELSRWHEFVWILETIQAGFIEFFMKLLANLVSFFSVSTTALWPFILLVAMFLIFFTLDKLATKQFFEKNKDKVIPLIIVTTLGTIFYSLMGYYAYRLSLFFAPLVLLTLGLAGNFLNESGSRKRNLMFKFCTATAVLVLIIYEITKAGPFS